MKRTLLTAMAGALVASVVSLVASQAHADIRLGEPAYGGTGCPAGSASVTLSPDQKSLSILFDQYMAEAGMANGKSLDRKSCNLAIPVRVPQGYSIGVFQVDYRGYAQIPWGGRGMFNVEYFFAGARGPRVTKNFRGGMADSYAITDRLTTEQMIWSRCGADVNLRVNTNILVQSNRNLDDALATVDSADVTAGLVYHIQWKRCN